MRGSHCHSLLSQLSVAPHKVAKPKYLPSPRKHMQMKPKQLYFFGLRELEEELHCLLSGFFIWKCMYYSLCLCVCMSISICTNVNACWCCSILFLVFFWLVRPIICFVCELFAEQFRSGCHTTPSGSHLNSKQLSPSANPLVITQPMFLIFQLWRANAAGKLLLPPAKKKKWK